MTTQAQAAKNQAEKQAWDYCMTCSEELDQAIVDLRSCNDVKKNVEWYQDPTVVGILVIVSLGTGYLLHDTARSMFGKASSGVAFEF